ncbi:mitochondrial GTPase 1 isoform X2 [Chelonus insularis]|uniref:mitochondrial GTPase 1 isoform X2 n=1 Tax=Chelonus insularis TaxID=460826 RepID=UPI00158ED9C3|nr:mitochondrial GTPase 1 isoform X2 [Chelonus insularis]
MANVGGNVTSKFRDKFRLVHKELINWFPGHMQKGLKQMQQKLKSVDCIVEVHDARIPISGRYERFRHSVSGLKPHIFVLNKKDLADLSQKQEWEKRLHHDGIKNIIYTNFKDQKCKGMQSILPLACKLIEESERYNRVEASDFSVMIIGVPNVGKSSLINRLRNKYLHKSNATAVGPIAGVTRSVLTKIKISEKPPVYVLDTPGILTPNIRDIETGLKLALVGCLQDHLVGQEVLADYLLYWLNKNQRFEYVDKLELKKPNDNIFEVLATVAIRMKKMKRIKTYNNEIMLLCLPE